MALVNLSLSSLRWKNRVRTVALLALSIGGVALAASAPSSAMARDSFPLSPTDPRAQLRAPRLPRPIPEVKPAKRKRTWLKGNQALALRGYDIRRRRKISRSRLPAGLPGSFAPSEGSAVGLAAYPRPYFEMERLFDIPESVIPPGDSRTRVTPTTNFPDRPICKLYIERSDGAIFVGTGTLVAPDTVMTAGHCVYLHPEKAGDPAAAFAKSIEVIPALDGPYKPYGSYQSTAVFTFSGWVSDKNPDADFGVIRLNQPAGNTTGWFGYEIASNATLNTQPDVTIQGYPGELNGSVHMFTDHGPIQSYTAERLVYQIDTSGGQSGSAVWRIQPIPGSDPPNTGPYALGEHTNGSGDDPLTNASTNSGCRITQPKFDLLEYVRNGGAP